MGLTPEKTTLTGQIPVFVNPKVLPGGFNVTATGFNEVMLPQGSLLKVDEEARTATLVKTAVLAKTGSGTGQYVKKGHHLAVGDRIMLDGGSAAYTIKSITTTHADHDYMTIGSAIDDGGTGDVLYEAVASGSAPASIKVKTVANALSHLATLIKSGEFVSAVVGGMAYKKRIQAHSDQHLADVKHIVFTESY